MYIMQVHGVIANQDYNILYINPENALNTIKDSDKINLFNIKLKPKTKAIPYRSEERRVGKEC